VEGHGPVVAQFEIGAVEAPGFSPAKQWAIEYGFSRGQPGLKLGSIVALWARLKSCPDTNLIVPGTKLLH